MLAAGGDLKNSFALAKDDIVVLGQFLGDLSTASGDEQFRRTLDHYMRIYDFTPHAVVSDLHPGYFTTLFADGLEEKGLRRVKVQHHHAHIAAVIEEHGLDGELIGIAFDGTGYGTDGVLWGSEFLAAGRGSFERLAHFAEFPLPGGESAIRDVWKIGVSLLHAFAGERRAEMEKFPGAGAVAEIIEKRINSPLTCSVGRLFDGIAALLGISLQVSTEAEAAMLLEEAAFRGSGRIAPAAAGFDAARGVIDTGDFVRRVLELREKGEPVEEIALAFHGDIARTAVEVAVTIREQRGLNRVALSGGAFQNRLLLRMIMEGLAENKFDIFTSRKVPFNDGCLALGQVAVARELLM
jgi:hydrogenase maturation protein HypF